MSQALDSEDEMTELEREIVHERMKNIEDEDSRGSLQELVDRL